MQPLKPAKDNTCDISQYNNIQNLTPHTVLKQYNIDILPSPTLSTKNLWWGIWINEDLTSRTDAEFRFNKILLNASLSADTFWSVQNKYCGLIASPIKEKEYNCGENKGQWGNEDESQAKRKGYNEKKNLGKEKESKVRGKKGKWWRRWERAKG